MRTLEKYVLIIVTAIITIGGSFLFYTYKLDGTIFNKPYTFYYDTQNMVTDKKEYLPGDWVYLKVKTCIHRRVHVEVRIILKDTVEIPYAEPFVIDQPVACFGVDKPLFLRFVKLPNSLAPDTEYRMFLESNVTLSTGRVIHYSFRTLPFAVLQ